MGNKSVVIRITGLTLMLLQLSIVYNEIFGFRKGEVTLALVVQLQMFAKK